MTKQIEIKATIVEYDSVDELMEVPGIGKRKAEMMVEALDALGEETNGTAI